MLEIHTITLALLIAIQTPGQQQQPQQPPQQQENDGRKFSLASPTNLNSPMVSTISKRRVLV